MYTVLALTAIGLEQPRKHYKHINPYVKLVEKCISNQKSCGEMAFSVSIPIE